MGVFYLMSRWPFFAGARRRISEGDKHDKESRYLVLPMVSLIVVTGLTAALAETALLASAVHALCRWIKKLIWTIDTMLSPVLIAGVTPTLNDLLDIRVTHIRSAVDARRDLCLSFFCVELPRSFYPVPPKVFVACSTPTLAKRLRGLAAVRTWLR